MGAGYSTVLESGKRSGGSSDLRREISMSWGDLSEGKKRAEEECWGFIGEGTECLLWSRGSGIAGEISGGVSYQRGEETTGVDDADRWVPPVIGGRGERVPFRKFSRVGRGLLAELG
jgi:hypothetical protein